MAGRAELTASTAGPEPTQPTNAEVVARLRGAGCVFAEDEATLLIEAARTPAELVDMVDRRAGGLPLEHVLGWAEFHGLRIAVDPGVFVPRHRTELLVDAALDAIGTRPHAVVLDLCCGSGAVATALLAALDPLTGPDSGGTVLEVCAADIDAAAAACAGRNLGDRGRVFTGDLYDALPPSLRGRIDVIVANAPYIPTDTLRLLPHEAREHEPRVALDGGAEGLDVQRRVAAGAPDWLARGGTLLIETSERQSPLTVALVTAAGLTARAVRSDDLDATVVLGTAWTTSTGAPGRDGWGS